MYESHDATVYSDFHVLNLVNSASLCVSNLSRLCLDCSGTACSLAGESFTRSQALPLNSLH